MNALLHSSTFAIIRSSRTKADNNGSSSSSGDGGDSVGASVGGHTKINDVTAIAKAKVFFVVICFFLLHRLVRCFKILTRVIVSFRLPVVVVIVTTS